MSDAKEAERAQTPAMSGIARNVVTGVNRAPYMTVAPGYREVDGVEKRGFIVRHDKRADPDFSPENTSSDPVPEYFVEEAPAGDGITPVRCSCRKHTPDDAGERQLRDGEPCEHMLRVLLSLGN